MHSLKYYEDFLSLYFIAHQLVCLVYRNLVNRGGGGVTLKGPLLLKFRDSIDEISIRACDVYYE